MSDALADSYDEFPYESQPEPPTHPDHQATVATLMGMDPAPPERCRVLELGCATGGNLVPMAATLPQSEFVGLDLSPLQIAAARATADALGLTNVTLLARSLTEVDDSFGTFDYVLCHGVYSWVPAAVQDRTLEICRRNLTPRGVAYVSYNTYPGWHLRGAARDLMRFHTEGGAAPAERVRQARAILDYAVENLPRPNTAYHRSLKDEAQWLSKTPDSYLFHEHLEESNQPLYFHEFVTRARAAGLRYVGEAAYQVNPNALAPEVRETLRRLAPDRVRQEQYVDFLTNRTFRRTLLCHAEVPLLEAPSAAAVPRCLLTAVARPTTANADAASEEPVEFRTDEGYSVTTGMPLVKAALLSVFDAWPRAVSFDELWRLVCERLPVPPGEEARPALAEAMLQCWLTNVVELHVSRPPAAVTVGERPVAFPLARLQAKAGAPRVCNLRHRTVALDDVDRRLVQLLDGTRDIAALRRELGVPEDFDTRLRNLARNSLVSA
jgi:methyltransferase-like protein/cyclopropane fatty-acyl-phospholipid synthase-like methyltransferase